MTTQAPKFICLRLGSLPRRQPKVKLVQFTKNNFGKSEARLGISMILRWTPSLKLLQ
jgi:hypothetical protein